MFQFGRDIVQTAFGFGLLEWRNMFICIVKVLHRSDWKTSHKRDNWKWWPMVLGKNITFTKHTHNSVTENTYVKLSQQIYSAAYYYCIERREREREWDSSLSLYFFSTFSKLISSFKNICIHICYKSKTHSLTHIF